MGKFLTFQEYLDRQRKQAPPVVDYQNQTVRLGTITSDFNALGGGTTASVIFDGETITRYLAFGVPVFAGDRVTCLKIGNTWQIIANGSLTTSGTRTFYKQIANSRTSTTTLAPDTELSTIPLGVGIWDLSAVLTATGAASYAGNISIRFDFTGTLGTTYFSWTGPSVNATDYQNSTMRNAVGNPTQTQIFGLNSTLAYVPIRVDSIITVTASGVLNTIFAQGASNATPTVLQVGSFIRIRRVK